MVDVVKWTFAAARMAWASDSVIQSAAEGIGQSAVRARVFDDDPDFDTFDDSFVESLVAVAVVGGGDAPDPSVDESASFDVPVSDEDDPGSDDDDPVSDEPSSPPADDAPVLTAARRSFFAQPEPL